jgi:hypothetical protein
MTVAGQAVTITQAAAACLGVSPTSANPAAGGASTVVVTTTSGCTWTAGEHVVDHDTGASGTGNGIVGYGGRQYLLANRD